MNQKIMAICVLCAIALAAIGCQNEKAAKRFIDSEETDAGGISELEKRIKRAEDAEIRFDQKRPDYLPKAMFKKLPEFPKDFYSRRSLMRIGRLNDLCSFREEYFLQPEFFPRFEEQGIEILKNPPKGRFGAYGIMSSPAETVASVRRGETLSACFFIKSSYLVELYQGISLQVEYPNKAVITSGYELGDGSEKVLQNPKDVTKYFDVDISPSIFLLAPNFPIFSPDGTKKVRVAITAKENTPPGNYAIGINVGNIPRHIEDKWVEEYLTLYATGAKTNIGRPYYTVFVSVAE